MYIISIHVTSVFPQLRKKTHYMFYIRHRGSINHLYDKRICTYIQIITQGGLITETPQMGYNYIDLLNNTSNRRIQTSFTVTRLSWGIFLDFCTFDTYNTCVIGFSFKLDRDQNVGLVLKYTVRASCQPSKPYQYANSRTALAFDKELYKNCGYDYQHIHIKDCTKIQAHLTDTIDSFR